MAVPKRDLFPNRGLILIFNGEPQNSVPAKAGGGDQNGRVSLTNCLKYQPEILFGSRMIKPKIFKQNNPSPGGFMFSFYLFRKYFFSSRGVSLIRTVFWVCLGGIAVSVAALILIISIMGGFGQSIIKRHLAGEPHLVSELEKNPFKERVFLKKTLPNPLKQGIRATTFYEIQDVILQSKERFSGAVARGYSQKKWRETNASTLEWEPPLSGQNTAALSERKNEISGQNKLPELLITRKLSLDLDIIKGNEVILIPAVSLLLPPGESLPLRWMRVAGVWDGPETGGHSMEQNLMVFYKQGEVDFGVFSKPKYRAEIKLKDPHQAFLYKSYFQKAQPGRREMPPCFLP